MLKEQRNIDLSLEKSELKTIIKCLIAFKVMSIILRIDYAEIKNIIIKLNKNYKENVFKE